MPTNHMSTQDDAYPPRNARKAWEKPAIVAEESLVAKAKFPHQPGSFPLQQYVFGGLMGSPGGGGIIGEDDNW